MLPQVLHLLLLLTPFLAVCLQLMDPLLFLLLFPLHSHFPALLLCYQGPLV